MFICSCGCVACLEELVSLPGKSNGSSWQTRIGHLDSTATLTSKQVLKGLALSAPLPLPLFPNCMTHPLQQSPWSCPGQCFGLVQTEYMTSPTRSPILVQMNMWRPSRKFRDILSQRERRALPRQYWSLWPLSRLRRCLIPLILCSCLRKP